MARRGMHPGATHRGRTNPISDRFTRAPEGTPTIPDLTRLDFDPNAQLVAGDVVDGDGNPLVRLGGNYWSATPYDLGPAYAIPSSLGSDADLSTPETGVSGTLVGPFAISSTFLTMRIAARRDSILHVDLWVYSPASLSPPYQVSEPQIKGGETDTRASTGNPNRAESRVLEPNLSEHAPRQYHLYTDRFGRLVPSEMAPFCLEREDLAVVGGGGAWRQVTMQVVEYVGAAVYLGFRVLGRSTVYINYVKPVESVPAPSERSPQLDPSDPPAPVWGLADLHTHPANFLGFGGAYIYGLNDPRSTDPADLGSCRAVHTTDDFDLALKGVPGFHGDAGYTGGPDFLVWPAFDDGLHEQAHPAWIRRAWEGGVRLMVALVVNSEAVSSIRASQAIPGHITDDDAVAAQVAYLRAVAASNSDWMSIAESSSEARAAIAAGRLAVVLGLEVDSLLGLWNTAGELSGGADTDPRYAGISDHQVRCATLIRDRLAYLHGLGIRQINPIHLTNNAFGRSALYEDIFNVDNFVVRRDYMWPAGDPSIDWRLGEEDFGFNVGTSLVVGFSPPDYGPVAPGVGHVNAGVCRGPLDTFAEELLEGELGVQAELSRLNMDFADDVVPALMHVGIIVDVDHMSQHTLDRFLPRCSANNYPVVSAHSGFRELAPRRNFADRNHPGPGQRANPNLWPNESHKSRAVTDMILRLGGMLAPIPGYADSLHADGCAVENNCAGTSRTYAQSLHFATSASAARGQAVGMGTDMTLNRMPGPRFGPRAANGLARESFVDTSVEVMREAERQADAQQQAVIYANPLTGRPRFRHIDEVTAFEEEPLEYIPYRSVSERLSAAALQTGIWNALWLYEAHLPADDFDEDTQQILDGLNAVDPIAGLSGLALKAYRAMHDTGELDLADPVSRLLFRCVSSFTHRHEGGNLTAPLTRCTAGSYSFDYNFDGLAHYGLLPDMLQDLKNVGLAQASFDALFHSAEAYLQIWQICEAWSSRHATELRGRATVASVTSIH